jgi:hypothetical protein
MVDYSTILIAILTGLVVILSAVIMTTDTSCPVVETPVIIPCNCTHTVEKVTVYVENKTHTIPKSINLTPDVQTQHFLSDDELIDRELKQTTPYINRRMDVYQKF